MSFPVRSLQLPHASPQPAEERSTRRPLRSITNLEELPPSARANSPITPITPPGTESNPASVDTPACNPQSAVKSRARRWLWPILIGSLGLGASWWPTGVESSYPAWEFHALAAQEAGSAGHLSGGGPGIHWHPRHGSAEVSQMVPVSSADLDADATTEVRRHLANGDSAAADQALRQAQVGLIPAADVLRGDQQVTPTVPTLSSGMREELLRGDSRCFHIHLSDSCAEDGDVVELIIDGVRFATVPITNEGATLSIPFRTDGSTTVTVRGVQDGMGGITVACRTSLGQGFLRVLSPGEEQTLAVIAR